METIKSAVFVLFISSLLIVLSAGAGAAAEGTIVIAEGVDVSNLDPQKASSSVDLNYCSTVFDGLLRRTGGDEIAFNLAESYRAVNPTTWEFKLRRNVFFHNGDPLTASDVAFSYNRTREQPPESLLPGIEGRHRRGSLYGSYCHGEAGLQSAEADGLRRLHRP